MKMIGDKITMNMCVFVQVIKTELYKKPLWAIRLFKEENGSECLRKFEMQPLKTADSGEKDMPIRIKQNKSYEIVKRLQDILLSGAALLILWPFMLIVALIIVIDSPGASPFYSQQRVGKNGKIFTFYKFRSMCADADSKLESLLNRNEMEGPTFKIKEDPRITRFGKFIRKCSIDELPQLINVFKGDMSIVGPRPGLIREVEQYSEYEAQRMLIVPGLTCYWQIQPKRNELTFGEWVALDIKYIEERSFFTDWKIIFKTFGAIFGMTGI